LGKTKRLGIAGIPGFFVFPVPAFIISGDAENRFQPRPFKKILTVKINL
jgi:hypothetical protein